MRIDLLFFGNAAPDLAVIAFFAIAATLFVHCNLLRQRWFLNFLGVATAAHVALIMMLPGAHLDPTQFKLFAFVDVLVVIGLVFCVEKLLSQGGSTGATAIASPDLGSSVALLPVRATRKAMMPARVARG